MIPSYQHNEYAAKKAFDKQAPHFDELYGEDTIIRYKRKRVRDHIEKFLLPASEILELNAGTGEDAIYFAGKGHKVHATDISPGMLDILRSKVDDKGIGQSISMEQCSFTELNKLNRKGPYDLVFSNFAGLNCSDNLEIVLEQIPSVVKPGGFVTLVVLPKFCSWEFLMLLRGRFKTAFRRISSGSKGTQAHIGGEYFRCWYYNPSFIRKRLAPQFQFISLEGLCTIVPPSYINGFAEKHPSLYRFLEKKENKWKSKWPWNVTGDYYILTMQKK